MGKSKKTSKKKSVKRNSIQISKNESSKNKLKESDRLIKESIPIPQGSDIYRITYKEDHCADLAVDKSSKKKAKKVNSKTIKETKPKSGSFSSNDNAHLHKNGSKDESALLMNHIQVDPSSFLKKNIRKKKALKKRAWTDSEDKLLKELVGKHGAQKWSFISTLMVGRVGKQCRERWHNHLNPEIKKDNWDEYEEWNLFLSHRLIGNKWAEISKNINGRTDNAIKNHWNSSMRKKIKAYQLKLFDCAELYEKNIISFENRFSEQEKNLIKEIISKGLLKEGIGTSKNGKSNNDDRIDLYGYTSTKQAVQNQVSYMNYLYENYVPDINNPLKETYSQEIKSLETLKWENLKCMAVIDKWTHVIEEDLLSLKNLINFNYLVNDLFENFIEKKVSPISIQKEIINPKLFNMKSNEDIWHLYTDESFLNSSFWRSKDIFLNSGQNCQHILQETENEILKKRLTPSPSPFPSFLVNRTKPETSYNISNNKENTDNIKNESTSNIYLKDDTSNMGRLSIMPHHEGVLTNKITEKIDTISNKKKKHTRNIFDEDVELPFPKEPGQIDRNSISYIFNSINKIEISPKINKDNIFVETSKRDKANSKENSVDDNFSQEFFKVVNQTEEIQNKKFSEAEDISDGNDEKDDVTNPVGVDDLKSYIFEKSDTQKLIKTDNNIESLPLKSENSSDNFLFQSKYNPSQSVKKRGSLVPSFTLNEMNDIIKENNSSTQIYNKRNSVDVKNIMYVPNMLDSKNSKITEKSSEYNLMNNDSLKLPNISDISSKIDEQNSTNPFLIGKRSSSSFKEIKNPFLVCQSPTFTKPNKKITRNSLAADLENKKEFQNENMNNEKNSIEKFNQLMRGSISKNSDMNSEQKKERFESFGLVIPGENKIKHNRDSIANEIKFGPKFSFGINNSDNINNTIANLNSIKNSVKKPKSNKVNKRNLSLIPKNSTKKNIKRFSEKNQNDIIHEEDSEKNIQNETLENTKSVTFIYNLV